MKKIQHAIIFHGTGGKADGNWFPWLKRELEKCGFVVAIPQFPDADKPSFDKWNKELEKYHSYINDDSVLIGHSLGGLFLLRVLESLKHPIDTAIFVAAPIGVKPIKYYQSDKDFSSFEFDWENIRSKAKHFAVFHSDNDPYVCLGNGQKLAEELGVKLNFIPDAGHLNAESGYVQFHELLKKIINISHI